MSTQLNNLAFYVNGEQFAYEADSLKWSDGKGTFSIRNAVVGGQQTIQIFSEDIKTKYGRLMVDLPTTVTNVKAVRAWKNNLNKNTLEIIGNIDGEDLSRIFTLAAIQDDPEFEAATEGKISLEWRSNPVQ